MQEVESGKTAGLGEGERVGRDGPVVVNQARTGGTGDECAWRSGARESHCRLWRPSGANDQPVKIVFAGWQ